MSRSTIHALLRGTDRFPVDREGWLTCREYDVLDMHVRLGVCNIYFFMREEGPHQRNAGGCEKMFTDLVSVGLLKGRNVEFTATETGLLLYQLTDDYLLNYKEPA